MPAPEGRAGNICIWFVTILLFLSILTGGALLVLFITLPESEETAWFPATGMVLVAIPWLFWTMTCFYRSMSGRGEAPAEGQPQPIRTAAVAPASGGTTTTGGATAGGGSPVDSPGGRRVHFGAATVLTTATTQQQEEEAAGGDEKPPDGGADGSSLGSHDSEKPFAVSLSSSH